MVTIINHPLVQHKLTLMRKKDTSTAKFRSLMREVSMLLGYEVTRHAALTTEHIETPVASMDAPILEPKKLALVSILRAGNGLVDGILQLIPTAKVGHIGLYRDKQAHAVVEYYNKLPKDMHLRDALLVDPMLATGETAIIAANRLKESYPKSMRFLCLLAAPEGIRAFHEHHPDIPIFTAAVDQGLNEKNYIVPGLGDAGDRLFGTI